MSLEAYQRSEERLRLALEAGRMGVWEWDLASGRVSWSPSLEVIHGVSIGTFPGTFEAFKRDIHPDDCERVLSSIEAGLTSREGHHLEYRINRPDGVTRWLEAWGRLCYDEAGRPARMLGVCMDITERKHVEEARELFISILGHDLRSPLGAIVLAAAILQRSPDLPDSQREAVARMVRSADRMGRIISDVLDFARGRLGSGIPIRRQPMDMREVCCPVVEELQSVYPNRPLRLEASGETTGWWDPERVAQAASNLITNALIHGTGGPVDVQLCGTQDKVSLSVINQGEPIAPEILPNLFQPFVGRSHGPAGLGLGLYIVHAIVQAHEGKVEVDSSPKCTRFTVHWFKRQ